MSIPCMLEKDCNGYPISTFPPCYVFQMIFTASAPRLIQSIGCYVHNKNGALKQLWSTNTDVSDLIIDLIFLSPSSSPGLRRHQAQTVWNSACSNNLNHVMYISVTFYII